MTDQDQEQKQPIEGGGVLLPKESRPKRSRPTRPAPTTGTTPELSIVLLSKSRSNTARCLHALASQVSEIPGDFEVVVVYTSTDSSLSEEQFPFRCRWVRAETRKWSARLNLGISKTRAPIVAFLAGDSVPQPGWLQAATAMDPGTEIVKSGPEPPLNAAGRAGCVYAALNNPLTAIQWPKDSGTRRKLRWHQASLRNLVIPRSILKKTGKLDESMPRDAASMDFCARVSSLASFETDSKLRASTDAYPDDPGGLWDHVFSRASSAGVGLGSYTHIYGRSRWVLGWSIGPWVIANFVVFTPWVWALLLIAYPALMILQIPRLSKIPGNSGVVAPLLCLLTAQCAAIAGMQMGLLRCLTGWLKGRKPFED